MFGTPQRAPRFCRTAACTFQGTFFNRLDFWCLPSQKPNVIQKGPKGSIVCADTSLTILRPSNSELMPFFTASPRTFPQQKRSYHIHLLNTIFTKTIPFSAKIQDTLQKTDFFKMQLCIQTMEMFLIVQICIERIFIGKFTISAVSIVRLWKYELFYGLL